MSGLDDTGTIVSPVCPLCEAWAVTVSLADVPWPLAGLLVEQAIDEHVGAHLPSLDDGRWTATAILGPDGLDALGF